MALPNPSVRLLDPKTGLISQAWFAYFRGLRIAASSGDSAALAELAREVANLRDSLPSPPQGLGSVEIDGRFVHLRNDTDNPGLSYFYGTGPTGTKGWWRVFDAINGDPDDFVVTDSGYVVLGDVATPADLPLTGSTGQAWRVTEESPGLYAWDGAAFTLDTSATGVVGLALAEVPDSGTGTLQATAFDVKGRKTGTAAATTDDLTEGTNLYYTDDRADARIDAYVATLAALPNAVDDTAAAALGVAIGGQYRNGSILMVRIS